MANREVCEKLDKCKTPVGCRCLCDLIKSNNVWRISPDVADPDRPTGLMWPGTGPSDGQRATNGLGTGGTVHVPTSHAALEFGAYGPLRPPLRAPVGARASNTIILGHELCGHAWFADRGQETRVPRDQGGHDQAIGIENAIRAEQGVVERRGMFRDPKHGESLWRVPGGEWVEGRAPPRSLIRRRGARR